MMVQFMMKIGGVAFAGQARQQVHGALLARKALGLAIVTSGFAVLAAQAMQHALGA